MIFTKIFLKKKGDRKTVEKKGEGKKRKKWSKEKNKGGRRKGHMMSFINDWGCMVKGRTPVSSPSGCIEALYHF